MARTKSTRSKSTSKQDSKVEKTSHIAKPGMDPKPPKEPISAFERFRRTVLPEYKKKMPGRTTASITQTIADKWIKMSDSQKSKFNQEFLDDLNHRYLKELEIFEKKYGPVKHKHFSVDDPPLKGMYYNSVAGAGKIMKLEPENKIKTSKGPKYQEKLTNDKDEEEQEQEHEQEETQDEERDQNDEVDIEAEDAKESKRDGKRRGRRAPLPPKRPQTAFFLFKSENFDKMKKKHPRANAPEISSLLADTWNNLSRNDKKRYEEKHDKAMQKYEKEMVDYEEQYGKVEKRRAPRSDSQQKAKKPRLSQYEMKVSDRLGTRPQIFPSQDMIGNKPRDPSRRRKPPIPI